MCGHTDRLQSMHIHFSISVIPINIVLPFSLIELTISAIVLTSFFLTDGVTTVATASSVGHIAVWGLDERRLVTVVRDAHDGIIGGMEFIQSQPLMVTSGNDNSIKVSIIIVVY